MKPMLNAGGVAIAIILGLVAGPFLTYAIVGDVTHTYPFSFNHILAGVIGGIVALGALINAQRYRNAGEAGAVFGIAAGVGEFTAAVLPWIGYTYTRPACTTTTQVCPLNPSDLVRLSTTTGLFALILFTIGGASLSMLIAAARSLVRRG
jgi:hypothetical protein